jgi:hypothetical protein
MATSHQRRALFLKTLRRMLGAAKQDGRNRSVKFRAAAAA